MIIYIGTKVKEGYMGETREFPTEVIASISTGFLLCKFDQMHEAAEWLMGHDIWTHHFDDKGLANEMRRTIAEQCPGMVSHEDAKAFGVDRNNYQYFVAKLVAEIGPKVAIRNGSGLTAMLPTDGIPEHVKVIQVKI